MLIDESSLPSGEGHGASVLPPWAMLRKTLWPLLPSGLEDSRSGSNAHMNTTVRHDGAHG
ncbi:hypothetical protein BH18ACT13_BH18ACT13_10900 [soil metagenome]